MPRTGYNVLTLILLLVLATPLVYGTHLLYPFVVYRSYFFLGFVSLAFAIFIKKFGVAYLALFWHHPIFRAIGFFVFSLFLSAGFSGHMMLGVFGNYERMMGALIFLHLAAYLVMLTALFGNDRLYRRILIGSVVSALLVSVYGFLQTSGIAFQIKQVDIRLFSTIGNPGFLAGFLLLNCGFSFYLFLTSIKNERWVWLISFLVLLFSLVSTATRGAILGAVVAGIFLTVIWSFWPVSFFGLNEKKVRLVCRMIGILFVMAGICFVIFNKSLSNSPVLSLQRLASISLSDVSTKSRLVVWRAGLLAFLDHPVLGWGSNAIAVALDRHFDPRLSEPSFDSTHNVILDILIANGVVGLLAYLYVVLVIFQTLWRISKKDRVRGPVLLAIFIGYGVQSLFLFDTLVVLLPLFIAIGLVAVVEQPFFLKSKPHAGWSIAISLTVVVLGLFHLRNIQVLSLVTDGYRSITRSADIMTAVVKFKEADKLALVGFGNLATIVHDASLFVFDHPTAFANKDVPILLDQMDVMYKRVTEEEWQNSRWFSDPAKVYLAIQGRNNPYLGQADTLVDRAIPLSPRRLDLYYAKAQVALQREDFDSALKILRSAKEIFPDQAEGIESRIDRLNSLVESYR